MKRVVILGGGGDMALVIARRLLELRDDVELVLADRDVDRARRRAALLADDRARVQGVDLFDARGLRGMVGGAALVVNATGPYVQTGVPVLEACIDERADYLDLGDDLEPADAQLAFHRAARDAGVTALIGAGIAPGVANVVVRRLADQLDEVKRVRVAWVTGATPPRPGEERAGRAVLEHTLHACTGMTVTVRDGRRRLIPSFRIGEILEFPPPLGPVRVYDLGHAEISTIPRAFPGIEEVRSQGGLVPAALNGVFQGTGAAVAAGRIPWDEAVDAILALDRGQAPRGRALVEMLRGIGAQLRRGELRRGDLRDLTEMVRGRHPEGAGGLRVDVAGHIDGRALSLSASTAIPQTGGSGGMDEVTGTPAAVFASLLLDGRVSGPGVRAPEQAVAPADLASSLLPLGLPGIADLFEPSPRPPEPLTRHASPGP